MNNIEITKREIIAAVSILAIMLIVGILIGGKVNEYHQDQNVKYNKAFKISKNKDLFVYAMKTNVGNSFVEGTIKAVEPVTHKDIKGKYLELERVKEKYTMHTRTVTTTVNGKKHTRIETYWTWDRVDSDTYRAKEVAFLGKTFESSKFNLPETSYIDTIGGDYHIRYKYYGLEQEFNATIFGSLKNNTIEGKNIAVYKNETITEILEELTSNTLIIIFWIIWIIATGIVIYAFIALDNDWLNKNR